MITRKLALAAAFIFAGTAAFSAISDDTKARITDYLRTQTYDRAEVRVGPSQIKIEMISGDQKVEVILRTEDLVELKRETETAGFFDNNTPGVFYRERKSDFLRSESDDDLNDDDEDGDDSDDDSSDDDSDDNSGGSDDSDDDSNDDNGGDRDGSDDSNDDNGDDDNSGNDDNSGSDDNSGDNGDDD